VTFAYVVGARRLALPRVAFPNLPVELSADQDVEREGEAVEVPAFSEDSPPLADWLAQAFVKARYAHRPGMVRRGRKWFSVPHCVAAVLLMRRLNLSSRAAAELLAEREDLRRAMRLTRAPSHPWFFSAGRIVRRPEKRTASRRSKSRTPTPQSCVKLETAPEEDFAATPEPGTNKCSMSAGRVRERVHVHAHGQAQHVAELSAGGPGADRLPGHR
jgi:hypothetical protein